ncbi:DUF2931 family protein [Flavobacterium psychrophilum]|nr:DUF2931 family protein [Flavobacterium psychrophilum]
MKKYFIVLLLILLQTNCKEKKMEEENFIYSMEISAEEDYPVEVHDGVLSNGKQFISAIPKAGIAKGGWGFGSGNAGMKAGMIPNHLELTYISYAEKKFWKIDTALPADKILALFKEGFTYIDNQDVEHHETYDELLIGLAPGGIVVVWLSGSVKKTEIGRFQAETIYVNKLDFQPVKFPDETQEEYFETGFKICVPEAVQAEILKKGIPFGLWDAYRIKYNWRYHTTSYKEDVDELVIYENREYINGELSINDGNRKQIVNNFSQNALPWRSDFYYKDYSSSVEFDKLEIMLAFKNLNKKYPNEPIEIKIKTTFMYKGLTFKVSCGGEDIPLEKTKVTMYSN